MHPDKIIEVSIGIDGFTPFESSSCTVWPILKIHGKGKNTKFSLLQSSQGKSKPKNVNECLQKFVDELNCLLKNGIVMNGVKFLIKIKFFICHTPARAFLKSWVGHTSLNRCERCMVVGKSINGVVTFIDTDVAKRTNHSFRTFAHPECHNGVSILMVLEDLDFILRFILDPMHSIYSGPGKRILDSLLEASNKKESRKAVKLSSVPKAELQRRTELINDDIPDEFPKK
ncbi:hypothetical protein QAD02_013232 [Eretmocerus hayati]|uniref:Uncharacterized protein n=1 Tax=Eretmocerus hayati TaxID=131215 RepID=A0ACC2P6P0_9HYME|nr:hypothetical protein QAD02_013232 [Eretmocerus hayati]